jgi:hypothetical protein
MCWQEKLVAALIVGFLLLVASVFVDAVHHHWKAAHAPRVESKGWTPPDIPQCDKELWERIKDRCGYE